MKREYEKQNRTIKIPDVIDYRITSRCNLHCPFCFGTRNPADIRLEKVLDFFCGLKRQGLNKVVITGGEPTCSSMFKEIVTELKKMNLALYLSTNGFFWNNDFVSRQFIFDNFECIALPIESSVAQVHNAMRPGMKDHYSLIKEILDNIGKYSDIKIKLETVVTQMNYDNIEKILDVLDFFPDRWKLYQLCKTQYNEIYYYRNYVTDAHFTLLLEKILEKYRRYNIQISSLYEKDRNKKHLFLEPDGTLMLISNHCETAIGNCGESMEELIERISVNLGCEDVNNSFYDSF